MPDRRPRVRQSPRSLPLPSMAPTTSFFLDLLRTAAALIVFIVHCLFFWDGRYFAVAAHTAHSAVIVFFVLSGYVIAYSTLRNGRGLRAYVVARLSRLYSVLAPALILTALLQGIGHALNPDFTQFQSHGHETFRYLAVAAHLQSVWTFSASPLANGPLWSLSYEFWYYALFGAAVLLQPGWVRAMSVAGVLLIAGPDILLLLPCWLAGVALFLSRDRLPVGLAAARAGFAILIGRALRRVDLRARNPFSARVRAILVFEHVPFRLGARICHGGDDLFFRRGKIPNASAPVIDGLPLGGGAHVFALSFSFSAPGICHGDLGGRSAAVLAGRARSRGHAFGGGRAEHVYRGETRRLETRFFTRLGRARWSISRLMNQGLLVGLDGRRDRINKMYGIISRPLLPILLIL